MAKKTSKDIQLLFYNFYSELLTLFSKKHPKHFVSKDGKFKKIKGGYEVSSKPKIRLYSCSYYFDNKAKIQKLQSFKEVVEYIKSRSDILKKDSVISDSPDKSNIGKPLYEVSGIADSYGPSIFAIAKEIFETYNNSKVVTKWDFNAKELEKIKLDKAGIEFKLNNKYSFLPVKKYYYLLENFSVNKTTTLDIDGVKTKLKKLTDLERSLIINSTKSGPEDDTGDIGYIETAIVSEALLKEESISNLLALLRIFKEGEFRLKAIGELNTEITRCPRLKLNSYAKGLEKGLKLGNPFFHQKYELTAVLLAEFKKFYKKNRSKMGKYGFAKECLSLLHATDDKFKIPIIFYILESFFPKVTSENTYRLSYCISKILNKPYDFTTNVKLLYKLRSDIVHGNTKSELSKTIKKIKKMDDTPCSNLNNTLKVLEKIMRTVWKNILDNEYDLEKIEEIVY